MSDTKTLPRLSEAQVHQLATKQSFERGDRYYRDGAMINPTLQGLELRADCQGSGLYVLWVHVDNIAKATAKGT
ncbi:MULTISPECIES: hypothetical protein [Trichocoleus]|uniref:Uncharacterized protein n=1 Tax=Trichocoleus desertorum GB2-A4 TaxID=2933944 RepID=A0ABV0J534_9CYAN|nr:hypothetical protein [Trichocoleus sp. FACHB-46]MBD1860775.1 hypothetical protein [Trichocoleus sp. FACHB-46]